MNESETRQKVIEQLEELKSDYQKRVSNPIYDGEEPRRKLNALDFAISSIKTDLKYDLLYEGEEIYTKADLVAMLTEILTDFDTLVESNSTRLDCESIVEQKIETLKE